MSGVRPSRGALLLATVVPLTAWRMLQLVALPDRGIFAKYPDAAARILAGDLPLNRLPDLSPGYLWTVVGLTALPGVEVRDLLILQVVALGAVALLAGSLVARSNGGAAGCVTASAVLLSPSVFLNATELEPETVVLVLDAVALWLLLRRDRSRPLAAGIALGASIATRPTALLATAALAGWLALRGESRRCGLLLGGAALIPLGVVALHLGLTGSPTLMNPGTVWYEGMNPGATGYLSALPASVVEVQRRIEEPDPLHAAYRGVAAVALGAPADPQTSNRYWSDLATRFAVTHPEAAARLVVRKAWLALAGYEAWDLATMERKARAVRPAGLGFGFLAGLAMAGALLARRRPLVMPMVLFTLASLAVPVAFYASSRHRNPIVLGMAILVGIGAQAAWSRWRNAGRRTVLTAGAVGVTLGAMLSVPGHAQVEERHDWTRSLMARALADRAQLAARSGAAEEAEQLRARAATWGAPRPAGLAPPVVAEAARADLAAAPGPSRRFDLALVLAETGARDEAEAVLRQLDTAGYRPLREGVPSSTAFQRARLLLGRGEDDEAARLLRRAREEAPGNARVLALAIVVAQRRGETAANDRFERELRALHDPLSVALARTSAAADAGDPDAALEWRRRATRLLRDAVLRAAPRSPPQRGTSALDWNDDAPFDS